MSVYLIFASLFLGSGLASIFARWLIGVFPVDRLFQVGEIPSFTSELAQAKAYDLTEFALAIVLSLLVFGANLLLWKAIRKKTANKNVGLLDLLYMLFAFVIFLQTHFVTFSGKAVLLLLVIGQLAYVVLSWFLQKQKREVLEVKPIFIFNGLLMGFFFLLIGNLVTTTLAIPLILLIITPVFYLIFANSVGRFLASPMHLLLLGVLLFPRDLPKLLILGAISLTIILVVKDKIFSNRRFSSLLIRFIYPVVIIALIVYNPLFYVGNFDTVEEGFWLSWLQRLIDGEVLYRDVAVYHPPLIAWGMYAFTKITEYSIYNTRLFLHLLQIFGLVLYYFVVDKLLQKRNNKLVVMLLAFSFTAIMVKNNVEIRLGLGLLPLIVWLKYLTTERPKWLTFSGIFCAIALFTSLEVGLAAIATVVIATTVFSKENHVRRGGLVLLGVLIGSIPFLITLWLQGALGGFVKQLSFYSNAFANGYFNLPIERAISLSFFRWHIFYQYLGSTAWMWEMTRMGLLAALMFVIIKTVHKTTGVKDKFVAGLTIFGLLLFRSALGRSDWFHLLFVLLVSLPVLIYVIEGLSEKIKYLNIAVVGMLLLVFSTTSVNENFLSTLIFKLQTYGRVVGTYRSYDLERSGILVGEDVNTKQTEELVKYIQEEVLEDETIFVYPWMPELYFLTDRRNATAFDTPYAFFSKEYQRQMVNELESQGPKFVIYNPEMNFANLTPDSLPIVNKYINESFTLLISFGDIQVLEPKARIDRDI
ncbi:glycosyltransferase family 39 protein [Patescibacteria group bacterium]|nr:glycosyltransferase family 39 protein [Patescibacteria group bacterium]